jgi:chromate reductase, NAD(P)H dehydrogenase (quinone)
MSSLKILAIPGSLRRASFNRSLARAAAELAPAGASVEIADLRDLPLYDDDVNAAGTPPAVEALKQRIAGADAVFIATPEYNYSVPGVLKNAIDWTSRGPNQPWKGKPVAIAGASPGGFGTVRAQMALREILVCLDAEVVRKPELYVSRAQDKFDAEGRMADGPTRETLRKLLDALAASVKDARPA